MVWMFDFNVNDTPRNERLSEFEEELLKALLKEDESNYMRGITFDNE